MNQITCFFPIVSAIGAISASVIALFIIFKKHKIPFVFPNFQTLKFYFKESIPIFTSNLSLKLYTGSNKIIIGMFLGMQEVAYYDLGEKLLNLLEFQFLYYLSPFSKDGKIIR